MSFKNIFDDKDFWTFLEFQMTKDFAQSKDKTISQYWNDGFIPESARQIRKSIEIKGKTWLCIKQDQQQWMFTLIAPSKFEFDKSSIIHYNICNFDELNQSLHIEIIQ
jgi:hypothetical protein